MSVRTGWRAGEKLVFAWCAEPVEDRQHEGRGLARPGLGGGEDVAALEHEWDGRRLDGRRCDVALFRDRAEEVGRQAERIEGQAGLLGGRLGRIGAPAVDRSGVPTWQTPTAIETGRREHTGKRVVRRCAGPSCPRPTPDGRARQRVVPAGILGRTPQGHAQKTGTTEDRRPHGRNPVTRRSPRRRSAGSLTDPITPRPGPRVRSHPSVARRHSTTVAAPPRGVPAGRRHDCCRYDSAAPSGRPFSFVGASWRCPSWPRSSPSADSRRTRRPRPQPRSR